MDQFVSFIQHNSLLVLGFLGILGLIIWTEFGRFTRKYKDVDASQAVRLINQDNTVVLDVRESNEVSQGRIQGARHIPLNQLASRLGELKSKEAPILVYCRSGNRSSFACNTLTKSGFTDISNLVGGIAAWESANLPLSKK